LIKALWNSPARNLMIAVAYVLGIGLLAQAGYMAAGWDAGDALYMVVLTIFTVGFDEVRPINTPELRALTIGLIVLGCTGMLFITGALVQLITITEIQQVLGVRRMEGRIEKLRDHVIVCGFGRIGHMLTKELLSGKENFVVIERDAERYEEAVALGYLCVNGNATEEPVLLRAGIRRARVLASVVPEDAANVFITLSARALNPTISIIARGEAPATERKLLQAGANEVVMPAHIGAERVAEMIMYQATWRLQHASARMQQFEQELRRLGLELEVVAATEGSVFAGLTVEEIETRSDRSFFIVSIERPGSDQAIPVAGSTRIEAGDGVMVVGRRGRRGPMQAFDQPTS
jgi:trk system potassium uptake protein TrkA/voltage-gated potassium channel